MPRPTIAAWWQTASTPAAARSAVSRVAQVALEPLGLRVEVARAARRGRRAAARRPTRTSWPRSRAAASTTCEPMNPAPPVTRIDVRSDAAGSR